MADKAEKKETPALIPMTALVQMRRGDGPVIYPGDAYEAADDVARDDVAMKRGKKA